MQIEMWRHMFVLGLPIAEKILRPILVYAFLIVGLRLAGKRELAQLNPFDLVVLLTLSNTVQNAIIGDDNSVSGGLIGATATYLIFDGFTASTMGGSFSQVVFNFQLSPWLIGQGLLLALIVGLVGGLFPALRAARMPIIAGLYG